MKTAIAPILVVSCIGSFAGCAADAGASKTREYLGSELVANADGVPQRCTNFYGGLDADDLGKLPINRKQACPAEGALGACELPIAASGDRMTQDEVVYYEGAEFVKLRDGDACSGCGVWSKPYRKIPPAAMRAAAYQSAIILPARCASRIAARTPRARRTSLARSHPAPPSLRRE